MEKGYFHETRSYGPVADFKITFLGCFYLIIKEIKSRREIK